MAENKFEFLFLFLMALKTTITTCQYSCRDVDNNPIDWFTIYKIPNLKDHPNPLIKNGFAYAFMSSEQREGWKLLNNSVNDTSSIPGLTLAPLYDVSSVNKDNDTLYILYNDEPPNGNVSLTGGHTKGVVFAGKSGGFWLVHSVPHYPPLPSENYSYPHTGLRNGQSYLCITLTAEQIDLVGTQLMYNDPHIFANSTPEGLRDLYPKLTQATLGAHIMSPPWYNSEPVISAAGTTFQTFAKAPEFNKDLYGDWVAGALEVNLFVETWPNGRGRLNSSCQHPYKVENVDDVKVPAVDKSVSSHQNQTKWEAVSFSSHKDHSKWAVSESSYKPWVCIGDINRAVTQFVRGGGTVCIKDKYLWQAYFKSVYSAESC